MDEAAADFKDIVERALANGDSLELERDGLVVGTIQPGLPPASKDKKPLGQFLRELAESWPDDEFGKDIAEGMQWSRSEVVKDKWEL